MLSHPANSQAQQVSTAAAVQSTVRESVGSAAGRSSPARAALAARRRAATWHAAGAVSDPNNSLERQEGWRRPCWGRAISRVRGSLREQRGEGCLALCELHVPCAAGSPRPAGHLLTWQRCTLLTHSTRPTARPRGRVLTMHGGSRDPCSVILHTIDRPWPRAPVPSQSVPSQLAEA